ncbi:fructose-6-phosphate aldolase [Blattabacterium cuenoti]|uniref:fructose-6-phosphate aldolase n=1 Tax=Blattabacterium cuenoti TaxID=1653831 RepID=UPI00163C7CDF|nr:fructose-6-phosphate aldolase [Blattabacterium cuenoti]
MKFFIDTANLNELKKAKTLGLLDGVTTNPSLIAKESICRIGNTTTTNDIYNHYISICNLLDEENGDVSAEIISNNYVDMIKEGKKISLLHPKIVVKVPATKDGIRTIQYLSKNKIKTNCTLIFSSGQALLAAKAGSSYISPFIGRLDDISFNGLDLIKEIKTIFSHYCFNTKIIGASIRHPLHIVECAKIGIYAVTSPLNVISYLINHPLTKIGLEKFLKDYNSNEIE